MAPSRTTLGLIALVTVALVVSSLGLVHALSPGGAASVHSPVTPATSASLRPSPLPTTTTPAGVGISEPSTHSPAKVSLPLSAPATPAAASVASPDASSPRAAQILSTLGSKGVPLHDIYLPYLLNGPHPGLTNEHINLSYTSSPAPYGIGDFGLENVSGVIAPYTLSTSSLEANFSTDYLAGYSAAISAPDTWGIQLNAVLSNVTILGETGYQYWTQNVFEYYPSLEQIGFVSNIWNFSNYDLYLPCNSFYQANGTCVPGVYYYGYIPNIPVSEPFSVQLYLNSTLVGGRDAVFFNYSVTSGLGTFGGEFDYAIFNSLAPGGNPAATPAPAYVANGFAYNPAGVPDDFEIDLGGPGGGSNFDVFESDSTYMSLQYWNNTTRSYTSVPSAYNVGGETGETSVGVNAAWTQFGSSPTPFPAACLQCVSLANGPSFQYGLWGVGGAGVGGSSPPSEISWPAQSAPYFVLTPANGFLFLAQGNPFTGWMTTNWSLFQWVPAFNPGTYYTTLPIGTYTAVLVAAENAAPAPVTFSITSDLFQYPEVRVGSASDYDPTSGVYTPLWAFNATGLNAISSGKDAYGYSILDNNEYAPMGQLPLTSESGRAGNPAYFPWFGAINVWGFPVFPGILLSGVSDVDVFNAPSFIATVPPGPGYQFPVHYMGIPETNNLQMFFWGDSHINFESSTVNGWFPADSDFGPSQSFANMVFWNTSYSLISGNTFATGGMALFLYGGYNNTISSNYFETGTTPLSANPYSTAAAYYGSVGLVDTDWGDAAYYGPNASLHCNYCDVIYNNVFDTTITATQLFYDPYTFGVPNQYPYFFSEAWNVPLTAGTNILGGSYIGGNYWWDYGYANNPYGYLPDREYNYLPAYEFGSPEGYICGALDYICDYTGGDYYPLVNVPLYTVTFEETGLPSGDIWEVEVVVPSLYSFQGDFYDYANTAPGDLNFTFPAGSWLYFPYSWDRNYSAVHGVVVVTNQSLVVVVQFSAAFVLTVHETGLPTGTLWVAEAYSATLGWAVEFDNTSELNLSGLLPGTYTLYAAAEASAYGEYAAVPWAASVTFSANTTVQITFVPVYTLDINAVGLPSGARWSFSATSAAGYNYSFSTTEAWANFSTAAVTYSWAASSAGYVAIPSSGTLDLTGNTTLTITFVAAATLTFTETGLRLGMPWTVSVTQGTSTITLGGTGSSIVFSAYAGSFSYTVSAEGYAATPSSGSGTLPDNSTVAVAFVPAIGTLGGIVNPSGATLWINGTQQTLSSNGSYSVNLSVGMHSIEATASGYATYFNNVTVALGTHQVLNIKLTSTSSAATGLSGISTTGWVLIAVLAALAAVFLVTTVIFARRRRPPPPPVAPYTAPTTPAAAPAEAAPPAWQESPPPPSGSS